MVEPSAHNGLVAGSSPVRTTKFGIAKVFISILPYLYLRAVLRQYGPRNPSMKGYSYTVLVENDYQSNALEFLYSNCPR